jgi:hypothetical protein
MRKKVSDYLNVQEIAQELCSARLSNTIKCSWCKSTHKINVGEYDFTSCAHSILYQAENKDSFPGLLFVYDYIRFKFQERKAHCL